MKFFCRRNEVSQSLPTVFCLTNMNGTMRDMCRKFHANNLACLRGCYDQLCQMPRTGQAVFIKIHVFCHDLKGYHLQFLEATSLYYSDAGICLHDAYMFTL